MALLSIPLIFPKIMLKTLFDVFNLTFFAEKISENTSINPEFESLVYSPIISNTFEGYFVFNFNNLPLETIYLTASEKTYTEDFSEVIDFAKELVNILGGRFIDSFNLENITLDVPIYTTKNNESHIVGLNQPKFTLYELKAGKSLNFHVYVYLEEIV